MGYNEERPFFCPISINFLCQARKTNGEPVYKSVPRIAREEAASEFKHNLQSWKETEMCRNIGQILDSTAVSAEISKIVAVSLGCLTYGDEARTSQHYQHAMIVTLRDWVKEQKNGADVPCYVQDPVYKDGDKAVLAEHEIQVIDDPLAWLEMDDFSIVVSISSNVPSREIIADISRPAVVIWNRVTNEDYDQRGGPSL